MRIKKIIQEAIKRRLLERKSDFDEYELTSCIIELYSNPDNTVVKLLDEGNDDNPYAIHIPNHVIYIRLKPEVITGSINLNNTMFESKTFRNNDSIMKCFEDKEFDANILLNLDFKLQHGNDLGAEAIYQLYDNGDMSIVINTDVYNLDKLGEDPLSKLVFKNKLNLTIDKFIEKVFHDMKNVAVMKRKVYHEFSHFHTNIKSNSLARMPDLSLLAQDEDKFDKDYANNYHENHARIAGIVADLKLALSSVSSGETLRVSNNITVYLTHLKQYQTTGNHAMFEKAVNDLMIEYNDKTRGYKKLTNQMKRKIEKRAVEITMYINENYDLRSIEII